ncbi:MAG: DUF4124 domain-containing protein [Gammaproteobacteria bacterium]
MSTDVIARTLRIVSLGLLLGAGLGSAASAGTLYKWTDKNGVVHYGDHLPARDAGKPREVLNQDGIAVKNIQGAKTPQQIAAEKRLEQKRAEEKRKAAAQAAHDQMLLDTFSSVDDMTMARNGKIQAIDAIIGVTQGRLSNLRSTLQADTREAAGYQRSGKPLPGPLKSDIANTRSQIQKNLSYIASKRQEQDAIRRQFAADIKRFKKLQYEMHQQEQEAAASPASSISR